MLQNPDPPTFNPVNRTSVRLVSRHVPTCRPQSTTGVVRVSIDTALRLHIGDDLLCGMLHSFHQHDICLGTLEITTDTEYTSKEDVEALGYGLHL